MKTSGCFRPRLFSGGFGGFTGEWKMAAEPEPSATPPPSGALGRGPGGRDIFGLQAFTYRKIERKTKDKAI